MNWPQDFNNTPPNPLAKIKAAKVKYVNSKKTADKMQLKTMRTNLEESIMSNFSQAEKNINQSNRSLSKNSKLSKQSSRQRKLFFRSKSSKVKQKNVHKKNKHLSDLKQEINKLKQVLANIQQLLSEVYRKSFSFLQEIVSRFQHFSHISSTQAPQQNLKFSSQFKIQTDFELIGKNYKTEANQEKHEKNGFPQERYIQIGTVPKIQVADLSSKRKKDDGVRRHPYTQRNSSKSFDFSQTSRISQRFGSFKQTLQKMKRLSFGGTIVKA